MYFKSISVLREKYRYKVLRYLDCIFSEPDTISSDCGELVPKRVSMGLTDRRKTAKNLVDSRKNWKILTVSRKYGKKELTVKEIVP